MKKMRYDAPKSWPRGQWSPQAIKVLRERYLWKNARGEIEESPEGMIYRVAKTVAAAEKEFGLSQREANRLAREFYELMVERRFLPNTPTLANAGKDNKLQYSACFVLPIPDSMKGIFNAIRNMALIHKSGGGTGFSFSRLRPKGNIVGATGGLASGPISFMKIFDAATGEIKQGGMRRGANMAVLRIDHPDIMQFIDIKLEGGITNFNLSVGVTDEFIRALERGGKYWLRAQPGWPDGKGGRFRGGEKIRALSARRVFAKIVKAAWRIGDPGLVFLDRINRGPANPVPSMGPVESTNPCGEQPLYPNEACNLGSLNLSLMVDGGKVNWQLMKRSVDLAVRFLDDVIDINPFPLEVITKTVRANRRIGLGVMGWADMLFKLGIPYDSRRAVKLAEKIMGFINETGHQTSQKLAAARGPFPNFKQSIYRQGPPIRNATVTTIAPTGTISIIGNASSGIEPLFALAYVHKANNRVMKFINPVFAGLVRQYSQAEKILAWATQNGSFAEAPEFVPRKLRRIFKTAHEIDWRWHIRMQAAFQKHTDNAVSKTINLPNEAPPDAVRKAYLYAYKIGCNGTTIFRDGCRGEQVLNMGTKGKEKLTSPEPIAAPPLKPRPAVVHGATYRVETPVGTAFVTVNHNGQVDQPLEVFITVGRAGSDIAADAEALGRLISLCLRISSPGLNERQVSELIIDQLEGIGGGSSVGFGKERVRSLADGIAKVLRRHLAGKASEITVADIGEQASLLADGTKANKPPRLAAKKRIHRDICPKCGNASLIYEEGCSRCLVCGYSKC